MACSTSLMTLDARVKSYDAEYVGTCVAWNDGSRGVIDGTEAQSCPVQLETQNRAPLPRNYFRNAL